MFNWMEGQQKARRRRENSGNYKDFKQFLSTFPVIWQLLVEEVDWLNKCHQIWNNIKTVIGITINIMYSKQYGEIDSTGRGGWTKIKFVRYILDPRLFCNWNWIYMTHVIEDDEPGWADVEHRHRFHLNLQKCDKFTNSITTFNGYYIVLHNVEQYMVQAGAR